MIMPREFFRALGEAIRLNRLTSSKIGAMNDRHKKLESRLEGERPFLREARLIDHIQEKVVVEFSFQLHDEGLSHLRFTREECPKTYNLMVDRSLPVNSEEEYGK